MEVPASGRPSYSRSKSHGLADSDQPERRLPTGILPRHSEPVLGMNKATMPTADLQARRQCISIGPGVNQ